MASSLVRSKSNRLITLKNVPTVQASPDYSTGDLLGGEQELLNAVELAGEAGIIQGVVLQNAAVAAGANIDAIFFDAEPTNTTFTENGAFAVHADDLAKIIGAVNLTTHFAFGANSLSVPAAEPEIPFILAGGTSLFCALVARTTINLAATTDIKFAVQIERC